jgi:CDP-diacylglycerol---serine O-phosphatidyltransferase
MAPFPKIPFKVISINRLIPNILTLAALGSGLTAIRFGLKGHFELAVTAIFIAAVLDALDGRVARLLGSSSILGAELDSLSDFLCFGIAPSLIIYMWTLQSLGNLGWAIVLIFAMCSAFRLARFNTELHSKKSSGQYFSGVPSPAGAGLVLLPLITTFAFHIDWPQLPLISCILLPLVGALEVSRLPISSFKKQKFPQTLVLPMLLILAIFIAFLMTIPWMTIWCLGIAYIIFIMISYRLYLKRKNKDL